MFQERVWIQVGTAFITSVLALSPWQMDVMSAVSTITEELSRCINYLFLVTIAIADKDGINRSLQVVI